MALPRSRLVRGALAQLRCSTGLLDGPAAAAAAPMAGAPHMPLAPPALAAPGAPPALAAAWQPARGISAATVLLAERQAGGSAPPPPPPAANGSTAAGVPSDDEEELSDDDAADAMSEAFERLIQAAFEMVQQGKPMEAEYVLSEGAKQAEEILGPNALELAALHDQLCVIRFLHERMPEAAEAAKRALDILKEHDSGFGPAMAIAATRYAAALLGAGSPQEAQLYTGQAISSLEQAMGMLAELKGDDEEEEAELQETREKFELGLGEARFYHALAQQAQNLSADAVGQYFAEMESGLQAMEQHLGSDSPLVAAALREHSRLIMEALEGDKQEAAEALYEQDVRLHMAAGDNFEHVALTLYQCGTLQYVMGKYEAAAESLRRSLATVRKHFPQAEEHLLTVQQRLGMVLALLGEYDTAKQLLHEVAPALVANLGEGNPANEEIDFMLALIGLREMAADGVADAGRRAAHLEAMQKHLKALAGYGEEHMLVKKAQSLFEEAQALTAAAGVRAVKVALRGSLAGRRAALKGEPLFSSFQGARLAPLAAAAATGRAAAAARRSLAGRAFATVAAPATEQETMVAQPHKEYFRKDYKPPAYLVDTIHLNFVLNEDVTRVESRMRVLPNHAAGERPALFLNGREDVKLVSVKINGEALPVEGYEVESKGLTIKAPPAGQFDLEIATDVHPEQNTSLEGLYKSGGNFCTQCEAEGFRGITFFQDRPDVMAKYTTRIEADKARYPVLLGNGNLVQSGDLEGGRHFTVWEDPFRKPCYLFALVAGNLAMKEDTFTTMSGKQVALRIFVNEHNIGRVDFAMESLKRSMKWDEDVFGLEYDLDLFNIVAVDDFNMGAMENKSLNIFNSRLVLATPDTATDGDFARIEGVVGHEYFHNFTGNRVTCRDWFQLTLKEGLTVYRDQEFSADMNSRPVKRIEDVIRLRAAQFSEDNGPMAHPIRPESYIKMDNFYTLTVYEKGAEVVRLYEAVVRLYEAVLGKEGFRKGMDLYFQRHDGQAVTCDDFLAAMADANGEDLSSLAKWYSQAGTPRVTAVTSYNPSDKTFILKLSQTIQPTPGQPTKDPVLIPVRMGLLGPDGKELPLKLRGGPELGTETVLRLTDKEQEFVFEGIEARPVPSLLRGFSAPVHLTVEGQTDEDLLHLLAYDTDSFNRWEAGHVLAKKLMRELYTAAAQSKEGSVTERLAAAGGVKPSLVDAYRALLTDSSVDGAFKAYAISLPELSELVDKIPEADPVLLYEVREYVTRELAQRLRPELEAAVAANDDAPGTPYEFNAAACARRALKNKALGYLAALGEPAVTEQLARRFKEATNMTDEISALAALDRAGGQLGASPGCVAARGAVLQGFFDKWQSEPLVLLKWFALQAGSNAPGNLAAVKALVDHPSFHITNPNSCYSLFLGFARSPVNFHAADGSGYEFLGDMVLKVDKINRQVASRLVSAFSTFKNYDSARQALMKAQLQRIVDTEGLSDNVFEIASKSLKDA
ncbi:puromycin-sensitive aminopeptidase isoform X1 isoform A [Chlorella sorokiniana]|uniref:Puromycin-sensitive aminopeptidase isoform X1 isoform A n=1 Tax=Chlorella sorokiniana TaxID=3076 RepID=A0A2P6TQ36_CHLSO|nr:puromycin-sensitive aminopeptidase isoform X1 isoform A [Chlorella sorokiniana]|eukprot:PRW56145.1 puromycin-sensitive aminopeptidase isoform X1 isoform A [Chlorella sorokiniana]